MVCLDHVQNLHIHAVRANILMSFSVDFRSDGQSAILKIHFSPVAAWSLYLVHSTAVPVGIPTATCTTDR